MKNWKNNDKNDIVLYRLTNYLSIQSRLSSRSQLFEFLLKYLISMRMFIISDLLDLFN